jgi:hypothetical protein
MRDDWHPAVIYAGLATESFLPGPRTARNVRGGGRGNYNDATGDLTTGEGVQPRRAPDVEAL